MLYEYLYSMTPFHWSPENGLPARVALTTENSAARSSLLCLLLKTGLILFSTQQLHRRLLFIAPIQR